MQVVGMTPPSYTLGKDSIIWGLEPNGAFSVRSAYLMITDNAASSSDSVWRHIWGWNGPNRLIAWRPGDEGWSTLNTDGSRLTHSGSTAIGGLIRDDGGRFIRAFTANIGDCSITRAELSAIVQGLRMAWSMGIRRIIVQSDSQTGISLLHREDTDHQHASLISEFLELKARGWDIRIDHVYREANFGADYLANLGHSCKFGLHFLFHPNPVLAQWLRYDLVGGALPRAVLI
ncbi:Putative ribonuclease H protein At1g65750 [Linum perenne]